MPWIGPERTSPVRLLFGAALARAGFFGAAFFAAGRFAAAFLAAGFFAGAFRDDVLRVLLAAAFFLLTFFELTFFFEVAFFPELTFFALVFFLVAVFFLLTFFFVADGLRFAVVFFRAAVFFLETDFRFLDAAFFAAIRYSWQTEKRRGLYIAGWRREPRFFREFTVYFRPSRRIPRGVDGRPGEAGRHGVRPCRRLATVSVLSPHIHYT